MLFKLIEKLITRGSYEKDDLLKKMDIYLLNNRITEAEYNELIALMDANTEV